MIRYDLTCDDGHAFDAWFADSAAYDDQLARGFLACPHCDSPKVRKAIMAPRVARPAAGDGEGRVELASGMPAELRRALREMRGRVMRESEDVGHRFAEEALAMHRGEIPERRVRGLAGPEEVRALVGEGVPFGPVPPDLGGH